MPQKIICITNDFGPRAGGIETFVMGLIERLPKGALVVYTSKQDQTSQYDEKWLSEFGVEVIRDKSKILLPTPRVVRAVKKIIKEIYKNCIIRNTKFLFSSSNLISIRIALYTDSGSVNFIFTGSILYHISFLIKDFHCTGYPLPL